MRSSKIRDVRNTLSKPRIFAIFLITALSLSIFYANFSNPNESITISQALIDSLLNSDKTTENQLGIPESTNKLTGKIESSLYNYASNINNRFQLIDSSIGVIILFDSSIDRNQRQELLKSMAPNSIIKYNYNLIPAISAIITSAELLEFLEKGQSSSRIQRITENHLQKISSPYLVTSNSNEEKWNTAFLTYNWWLDQINATGVNYTGKGIKLAIMDTGISVFPDFFTNGDKSKNRIILSRNFVYEGDSIPYDVPYDQYGHGTHVAGIAGGNGFLSEGKYQGVAPEVNLINARIFNSTNDALEDATIAAIEWCVNESVDIINMSFGSSIPEVWNIENYAIEMAVKQGVIVVAAAGNEGPDFFTGSTPATGMYAISVGATDNKRHMADFSSLGSTFTNQLFPQVAAPGVDIISALSMSSNIGVEKAYLNEFIGGNDYFKYIAISGTSMATPMVCGAIALLLEAFPEATPESIRNALILTANPVERVSGEGYGTSQGAGLINVKGALEYLSRIKSLTGNVNNQSCLYSREIPYSPNDFLKFPGDKQSYNITAYAGMAMTVEVDLPSIDGVSIVSDKTILSFTNHSLQSLSLDIQINYNSTPGLRNAYIKLKDSNSGWIYDSIPIVINITAPKARIYFDSYHGLNDYYPRRVNGFSQIDLYHAMHDLIGYNYALEYNMENWTTGYSAEYNATLLNEEILSRVDVLVLQTPILPYTASEIAAITNFFNNGGSILYLGTKSELVCQKSLNSLFNALKIGIQINPTNVFNWTDYGFSASYNLKMVKDLNRDNNIFDGVNQYFFGYGHTFSISPNARNLSSINGNIVAAAFQNNSQNSTQGRFIGLGDYRVFRSSIYNNAEYYGNHSRLLKNIMDYLSKMDINSPRISISINDRIPSSSNLDLGIEFWDYNLNSNITFFNGTTINATLYTSNNIKSLNISCVGSGMHEISHEFEFFDKSNITIILNLNYSYQSVLYSKNYSFYYYPDLLGYTNFTFSTSLINRSMTNLVNISISNQTTLINSQFYISITTNTALAFRQMDELNKSAEIFNQSVSCSLNSTEIGAAGLGLIYNEEILLVNNQHYLNFFANRYSFSVNNVDPLIDLSKSTFGGLKFSETQSGGYASLISAELGGTYDLEVILNESLLYEEQIANLSVSCSFWPIYVYNGFINFMYPNNIPSNVLSYNAASQAFVTSITIPTSLEWVSGNQTVARSFESDTQNYFALCVISVRDYDGGSDMFYMIFNVWKTIPELDNNTPLLLTFGILAVAVFILNRRPRNVPISNFTSADF